MKRKPINKILSWLLTAAMAAALLPFAAAPAAAQVTGTMIIKTDSQELAYDGSGDGWSWEASTGTLALTGDVGSSIVFFGDVAGDVNVDVSGLAAAEYISHNNGKLTFSGSSTLALTNNDGSIEQPGISAQDIELAGVTINVDMTGNRWPGVSVSTGAFTITGGGAISLTNSGTGAAIEAGNITVSGGTLTTNGLNGNVTGSLIVDDASADVDISGNLAGDLTVSGGTVTITGTVSGTGNVSGGAVYVNGATVPPSGGASDLGVYAGSGGLGGGAGAYAGPIMSLDAGKWMTSPLSTGADGAASVDYTQTGGTETLSIPDSKVNEIIGKSTDVADIDLTEATNATSASLPKTALTKLADSGLAVELRLPQGTITLNADAASSIAAQAGGGSVSVALKTVSETVLNPAQKAAVGDAPVYDISVTSGSETLTDFGGASVKLELPYALKAGEKPGGVVALYVDGDGNTEALPTVYDESSKKVTFTTTHLSLYAIGYDESISAPPGQTPFADVKEGDWFYEDVAFVAANGLFSGTSGTAFSPNAPMTRAMFVTVLYRLAGSPAVRENAAFDDVDDASWYGEAVNWAAQSGIVSGVGGGLFAPESNLTREQTAVILLGYAKYAGAAPQGAWAVRLDFADTGKIADWATEGAMYCYMNGIITGKPGGLFDPQGEATRAEAAAMLRQFIVAAG